MCPPETRDTARDRHPCRPPADGSALNLGVDLASLVAISFAWRKEVTARETRLKRITAGAAMAALRVQLMRKDDSRAVKLAELRTGRGSFDDDEGLRVVIVAAAEPALGEALRMAAERSEALVASDLLFVPVLLDVGQGKPRALPPPPELLSGAVGQSLEHLALPQAIGGWQEVRRADHLTGSLTPVHTHARACPRPCSPASKPSY